MPAQKLAILEQKHGSLHNIIPDLVNHYGQWEAGRRLGVSGTTIHRWLKKNGYTPRIVYDRLDQSAASHGGEQ